MVLNLRANGAHAMEFTAAMCAEKLNKKTTANYYRNLENKNNPIFESDNEDFHSFDW